MLSYALVSARLCENLSHLSPPQSQAQCLEHCFASRIPLNPSLLLLASPLTSLLGSCSGPALTPGPAINLAIRAKQRQSSPSHSRHIPKFGPVLTQESPQSLAQTKVRHITLRNEVRGERMRRVGNSLATRERDTHSLNFPRPFALLGFSYRRPRRPKFGPVLSGSFVLGGRETKIGQKMKTEMCSEPKTHR
jgi:hypothetical protein